MSKHVSHSSFVVLGLLSAMSLAACNQNSGPTSTTTFEAPAPPSLPLVSKTETVVSQTHVPAECPKFAGVYIQDGRQEFVIQEQNEHGSTYVIDDGKTFIADGQKHLGPESVESVYVAECKNGELKVTVSSSLEQDAGKQILLRLKPFTADGDFKLTISATGEEKSEEVIYAAANRALPRAKHNAAACPALNGEYTDGSSEIVFGTKSTGAGNEYIIGGAYGSRAEAILADGQQRVWAKGGEFDSYVATCDAGTVKVYFGKKSQLAGMSTFKLLEDGTIDGVHFDRGRNKTESAKLKPKQKVVAPAAEPVTEAPALQN